MSSNISSMLQFWRNLNLTQLQRELDVNATELANRQDASDVSRRKLVEQSKEFKKVTPEDVRKSVAPLLRSFQSEIDALSKRSKACEADFLTLYKKLVELPDPVHALEQAEQFQRKAQRLNDVETENQKLRETLAEYNKEFAEVKNQEVTIKNLREKVRDFERGTEDRAKQLTIEKNEELQKQFAEKEKKLQETQLLIATKLGEAEQMAATFKGALEGSQAELFDLKSKYDEETAAKQSELDLVLVDLERSAQRIALADKEIEQLRKSLSESDKQSKESVKPSTAMEEAFEVLSRSSLEAELANKEKEISQLVEDVQHLQGSMGKLRESSASAIAKLEEELGEKNGLCQDFQRQIAERADYNEIKRELQIIKSTEFSTLDTSVEQSSLASTSKAKSLEMLLLEKNRAQQSENTTLRAANAQLTGADRGVTTPPTSPTHLSRRYHRKEKRTPTRCRQSSSSSSRTPQFSPTQDYTHLLDPDALSQLQIQKQRQLNALLNLKILASLKAAVAAQNVNSAPTLGGFIDLANQAGNLSFSQSYEARSPNLGDSSSHQPHGSNLIANTESLSKYLIHLQKMGQKIGSNTPSQRITHRGYSEDSDNDNYVFSQNVLRRESREETSFYRHGDHTVTSHIGESSNSNFSPPLPRYKRYSLSAETVAHTEEVDTEDLTCQVKELLQAHNIGQRAFGQYILGLSQGSVSEILSKPKPWSKLTFKGKEPFLKMMDFLSSSRNLEALKSLQRKDREERVLCGGRGNNLRQSDSDSDQAIVNILAAAREEMKAEQEKLKRAQEIYTHHRSIDNSLVSTSNSIHIDIVSSSSNKSPMTTVAPGRCSYNDTNKGGRFTEKIMTVTTNGTRESILDTGMPSLIKRQQRTATGNENGRAVKKSHDKDKQYSVISLSNQNICATDRDSEKDEESNVQKYKNKSNTTNEKDSIDVCNQSVKSEPKDSAALREYFTTEKEGRYSPDSNNINSESHSDGLQHYFTSATRNDPFIPPPLSPSAEDTRGSSESDSRDQEDFYGSSLMKGRFIGENLSNSERAVSPTKSKNLSEKNYSRKRVISLSPLSRHSTGFFQDPGLFKELSCEAFNETERSQPSGVTSSTPSTFSSMLSSNMSSLQTSSSMFNSHTSYTELSPVTTGSLYSTQRDASENDFRHGAPHNFATLESAQNGISSMLPPLGVKSQPHHGTSPVPTYSTLTNTLTSAKYASYPEEHSTHSDQSYDDDHLIETSSLMSPIPPEALHKLSMSHVDTASLASQVRERLAKYGICQRIFGEKILGLSQGTVSDILSHPKPWGKLTHKGREPFARMILWLADATAGGLMPTHEGLQILGEMNENSVNSPTGSSNADPVNLTKDQANMQKEHSPSSNGTLDSNAQYVTLSPHNTTSQSPSAMRTLDRGSPHDLRSHALEPSHTPDPGYAQLERHFASGPNEQQGGNGAPVTPLQQMLNIQELAASCPKLDTFALTRKVKDLLTEHNIGQRIFGQAVLGLTQGSVSDLLSRPKLWRSLSLKGREPFVRMQLWLSDPNNIEQLKSLKLERWMEKKWGGKRQRSSDNSMPDSLSPVKKQRIVLSTEEKQVLRRAYAIEPYPSQETVDLLAVKLSRKSSTIVNWFHNYRSRVKRGFFPGEEINDGSNKKSSSKMTVKQLLDSITLTTPPSAHTNQGRGNFTTQRPFSSKTNHNNGMGSNRRQNHRMPEQISPPSWVPHGPSPTNFERYAPMEQMKTETLDQHFQNLQRSQSDDIYANSVMHVKEEAKMMALQSENDAMFSAGYSYPTSNTVSDIFKSAEMTLNDPVAMAAASSFIQPKPVHQTSHYTGGEHMYTNLDEPHHDNYVMSLSNDVNFNQKLPVSSPGPHGNNSSILPPVHTLTPKKSFGSPPALSSNSNIVLPSASSLLHPSQMEKLPSMGHDLRMPPNIANMGYGHSRPTMHRLVNLSHSRYDGIVANNNMNNNSENVENLSLPVSLGSQRSPIENDNKITATVWVSSPSGQHESAKITSNNATEVDHNQPRFATTTATSMPSEKETADDSYAWVF